MTQTITLVRRRIAAERSHDPGRVESRKTLVGAVSPIDDARTETFEEGVALPKQTVGFVVVAAFALAGGAGSLAAGGVPVQRAACLHVGQVEKGAHGVTFRCVRHGKHGQWAPVPAPAPRSTYYDGTYGGQLTGSGSTSWQLGGFFAGSDFEFTVAGSAIDLSGEGKIGVLDVSKGVAAVRFATRPDNRLSVTSPLPPAVVGSVHDCSGTIQFSSAKAATGSFTCTLELTNSETIQVTSSPTSVAFEAKRIR